MDRTQGIAFEQQVRICQICRKVGEWKHCGKCRSVYYCGVEHQRQDWSEHKKLCQSKIEQTKSVNTTFGTVQISGNIHVKIASNIKDTSIEKCLEVAQVVLLTENHSETHLHRLNGEMIEKNWKEGDLLLTEGSPNELAKGGKGDFIITEDKKDLESRFSYLSKKILEGSKSWDVLTPSNEEVEFTLRDRELIEVATNLYSYLYLMLDATSENLRDCDDGIQELLEDFYPTEWEEKFNIFGVLDKAKRIEFLKQMGRECLKEMQKMEQKEMEFVQQEFFNRNHSMVNSIFASLKIHKKVWVIAGYAHCQYRHSREMEAVAHLYNSFEEKKVKYVTLKYLSVHDNHPSEYVHSIEGMKNLEKGDEAQHKLYKSNIRKNFDAQFSQHSDRHSQFLFLNSYSKSMEDKVDERLYSELILEKCLEWK